MAVTRIKDNQVTDLTLTGAKIANKTIAGGKLIDDFTYSGNMTVAGNLVVSGTTSTVDTTNTVVADPLLLLSRNATGSASVDSGIIVERGTNTNTGIIWDESADSWVFINTNDVGSTVGDVAILSEADLKVGNLVATGTTGLGNLAVAGNILSSTNTDGNIVLTPNGAGEVYVSTLTSTQLVFASTNGRLDGAAGLTFNGTTLTSTGGVTGGNLNLAGNTLSSSDGNVAISGNVSIAGLTVTGLTANQLVVTNASGQFATDTQITYNSTTDTLGLTGTLNVVGQTNLDNLRVDGNTVSSVNVNGNINLTPDGTGEVIASSLTISDLTATRVSFAGTGGAMVDSANFTFTGGNLLSVTGSVAATAGVTGGNLNVAANTLSSTNANGDVVIDPNGTGVVNVSTSRITNVVDPTAAQDAATKNYVDNAVTSGAYQLTAGDSALVLADTGTGSLTTTIDGNVVMTVAAGNVTIAAGTVVDLGTLTVTGATIATQTTNGNIVIAQNGTGSLETGTLAFHADTITSTLSNGSINLTATGTGDVVANTLAVSDLTATHVVFGGTAGAIEGSANLTYNSTSKTLTMVGTDSVLNVGNLSISGHTIESASGSGSIIIDPYPAGGNAAGDVFIYGNLTVTGVQTTVNSTVTTVDDPTMVVGVAGVANDGLDRGIVFNYYDGAAKKGFFGWDNATGEFQFLTDAINSGGVVTGTNGNLLTQNVKVTSLTAGRVVFAGTNGQLIDDPDFTFDGLNLTLPGSIQCGNIHLSGDTIATTNVNGDLTLSPNGTGDVVIAGIRVTDTNVISAEATDSSIHITANGTGEVVLNTAAVSDLTSGRVVLAGTAGALVDSANLTFNGTTLTVPAISTSSTTSMGNISIGGNTISSTDTNGNINLVTNGSGEVIADSLSVSDLTATRLVYVGASGSLVDSGSLTFNGTTLNSTGGVTGGNVNIAGNTLSSTDLNGNVYITPNGTGATVISNLTVSGLAADRLVVTNASGTFSTDTQVTYDSTTDTLGLTGTLNVTGQTNLDNLRVDGNAISSTDTNGNINLTPNGTGEVIASSLTISDLTATRVSFAGTSGAMVDSANFTFTGGNLLTVTGTVTATSTVNAGNVRITGNTVSATDSNGALYLAANGIGNVLVNSGNAASAFKVAGTTDSNLLVTAPSTNNVGIGTDTPNAQAKLVINSTDSLIIPKGTQAQRPATPVSGMVRFNTSTSTMEFYNGVQWQSTDTVFTVIADQQFAGDDTTVAFALSSAQTTASCVVSINGVVQLPTIAYSVSGTTLTFTEAPLTGDVIDVRMLTTTQTIAGMYATLGYNYIDVNDTAIDMYSGTASAVRHVSLTANGVLELVNGVKTSYDQSGVAVGTGAVVVDSFALATYRSAKYLIQVTNGSNFEASEVLAIHNGTTGYHTQYAIINNGSSLGTVTFVVNGANCELRFAGASTGNTVKVMATYVAV